MIVGLWVVPMVAGVIALLPLSLFMRRGLLIGVAVAHSSMLLVAWLDRPEAMLGGWVALDSLGLLFLTAISLVFLTTAIYAAGYLDREPRGPARPDFITGVPFVNQPEALFIAAMLFLLAAMTLVTVSQQLGLMWAAVEFTALSSAPLIYFHRHKRALEAAWKYLLLSSVGVALALLGTMFVSVAASASTGDLGGLVLSDLMARASSLDAEWMKAAFILLLVGYGTKMGLAPMHSWLPDTYSEAPSIVAALLSGALSCSGFLALLRIVQLCNAAGLAEFCSGLLVTFGLVSMAVAAVFVLRQPDYKRLLAYSSIEHMGIMTFGVGIGGHAGTGAMLLVLNHSAAKAMLFLVAGNILTAYRTKSAQIISGLFHSLPLSGMLWVAGFLAIIGSPPFGTFFSELLILKGSIDESRWALAALFVVLLAIVFVGMASVVLHMAQGRPADGGAAVRTRERWTAIAPPVVLGLVVLLLGLYLPGPVEVVVNEAAAAIGGGR